MAENKKSFIAYSDWNGMFKALPDEVAGKLIKHIFSYVNDENPSSDDYVINALFEQIKSTLKRDLVKWENERQQRVDAGRISAERRATKNNERSTVVDETTRNSTVNVSVSDNVNVNVNDNEKNKSKKEPLKRFTPPSFDEVKGYCFERKNNVDTEKFINHYTANGWMVGRNKMKDWKAAIRTWEKNNFSNAPQNTSDSIQLTPDQLKDMNIRNKRRRMEGKEPFTPDSYIKVFRGRNTKGLNDEGMCY